MDISLQDCGDFVSAVCGVRADKAYTWRMMGEGGVFKEQHRERLSFLDCGKELV